MNKRYNKVYDILAKANPGLKPYEVAAKTFDIMQVTDPDLVKSMNTFEVKETEEPVVSQSVVIEVKETKEPTIQYTRIVNTEEVEDLSYLFGTYVRSKSTDEIIEYYTDQGYTYEEAKDIAEQYISSDINFELPLERFNFDINRVTLEDLEEYIPDIMNIECDFKGILQIEEYNDDKIYIPSSYYCAIKCIEKCLNIEIDVTGLSPVKMTAQKLKKHVEKQGINWSNCPCIVKISKEKRYRKINYKHKSTSNKTIVLVQIEKTNYHAVLVNCKVEDINKKFIYKGEKVNWRRYIKDKISFKRLKELSDKQIKIDEIQYPEMFNNIYCYDLETPMKLEEHKRSDGTIEQRKVLYPYGCGYQNVRLIGYKDILKGKKAEFYDIKVTVGLDCIQQMFDDIRRNFKYTTKEECKNNKRKNTLIFFAHNGGNFDHIYCKGIKGLIWTNQLKSGGGIKQLIGYTYKDKDPKQKIYIKMLDSCAFTQATLKKSAKYFNTSPKMDFDIKDKPLEWYQTNTQWIEYLKQDVKCLSEIVVKFDEMLRGLSESMTTNCGVASVAWRIMRKCCTHLDWQYLPKEVVTQEFIRQSCYGGRMIHYKKYFKAGIQSDGHICSGLVCLDGTSLYPSAMYAGLFPVGKYKLFESINKEFIDKLINEKKLFITEVTLDAGNIRYPLIPYKDESGLLTYRAGIFTGVYNSVDIVEALKLGYKIIEVKRGLYWDQSEKIFEPYIYKIFDMRKKCKAEKNPMEYMFKILYNSGYGKFLEYIDTTTKFGWDELVDKDKKLTRITKLTNGQYQKDYKLDHGISKKPIQLGSFVLSYARSIMNRLVGKIGPEKIYYGDTDSLYIERECLDSLKEELKNGDNLCGFKNDYGQAFIIEAIFLDVKRYLVIFDKEHEGKLFYNKFNGINFKCSDAMRSWGGDTYESIYKMYKWLNENPGKLMNEKIVQEKWLRSVKDVQINDKEIQFQVSPDKRAQWILVGKNEYIYFPLQYKLNENERKVNYTQLNDNSIEKLLGHVSSQFIKVRDGIDSALPLCWKGNKVIKTKDYPKFKTSFVIKDQQIYKYKIKNNEHIYYDITPYGPYQINKTSETPDHEYNIVTVDENKYTGPIYKITQSDIKKIERILSLYKNANSVE